MPNLFVNLCIYFPMKEIGGFAQGYPMEPSDLKSSQVSIW